MSPDVQIFLSYSHNDREKVEILYMYLFDKGFNPWMDIKNVLPGEVWAKCIHDAIIGSDFFIACLSLNSVNKRGLIQSEIKSALEVWATKLSNDIYLIPVRLDECEIPAELKGFQYVDIENLDDLLRAIKEGLSRRGVEFTDVVKKVASDTVFSIQLPLFQQDKIEDFKCNVLNILASQYNWRQDGLYAARIVMTELANNAFEYGCCGKGDLEVSVEVNIKAKGMYIVVRVVSPHIGFDLYNTLEKLKEQDNLSERGRGLLLVKQMSVNILSSSDGTIVQATVMRDNCIPDMNFKEGTLKFFENDSFSCKSVDVKNIKYLYVEWKEVMTNARNASLLKTFFYKVLPELERPIYGGIIISLKHVQFMESSGIGVLASIFKMCYSKNLDMHLCDIQLSVLNFLQIVGLNRIFYLYENYDKVIKFISQQEPPGSKTK
jgi:anti-anti-sigma factor